LTAVSESGIVISYLHVTATIAISDSVSEIFMCDTKKYDKVQKYRPTSSNNLKKLTKKTCMTEILHLYDTAKKE